MVYFRRKSVIQIIPAYAVNIRGSFALNLTLFTVLLFLPIRYELCLLAEQNTNPKDKNLGLIALTACFRQDRKPYN
jgi:hypothetical protein